MDPIHQILHQAINPTATTADQKLQKNHPDRIKKLKKKGLCIDCGLNPTHHKSWGTLKPIDSNKPCYKEYLCIPCYEMKRRLQLQQEQRNELQLRNSFTQNLNLSTRSTRSTSSSTSITGGGAGGGGSGIPTGFGMGMLPSPGMVAGGAAGAGGGFNNINNNYANFNNSYSSNLSVDDASLNTSFSGSNITGGMFSLRTGTTSSSTTTTTTGRESTFGGGHYAVLGRTEASQEQSTAAGGSGGLGGGGSSHSRSSSTNRRQQQRLRMNNNDRDSKCTALSVLPDTVWKVRADETLQEPRDTLIFPNYTSVSAVRDTTISIIDFYDPSIIKHEMVHVLQLKDGRPAVAYRKLSYPPPVKTTFGEQVFCTKLTYNTNTEGGTKRRGFYEPDPREKWSSSSMVLLKQIEKQYYFGLDSNDSPYKDATVLQQIHGGGGSGSGSGSNNNNTRASFSGTTISRPSSISSSSTYSSNNNNHKTGILECTDILEDDIFLYLVCPIASYKKTLADVCVRHPRLRNPNTFNPLQEEEAIKPYFRQLILAIQTSHMHGLCHRNLDPKQIMVVANNNNNNSSSSSSSPTGRQITYPSYPTSSSSSTSFSSTVLLSDFSCSLLVPNTLEKRYLMNPGISGGSNKRYMAPEVYHYQIYDGMAADIWSCGIILFELLTGCKLHKHPNRLDPIYTFFIVHHQGFLFQNEQQFPEDLYRRMTNNNNNNSQQPNRNRRGGGGPPSSSLSSSLSSSNQQMQDLLDSIEAVNQLSLNARNLLTDLLQEYPPHRLSIQEILNHPWFLQPRPVTNTNTTNSTTTTRPSTTTTTTRGGRR